MKLAWEVRIVDEKTGAPTLSGYGPTQAANITAAMVQVRGELEAITDA